MSTATNVPTTSPILVLGATGKVGSRVIGRLHGLGYRVRVGSRSGRPPFDWHDPSTWVDAVAGVDTVFVSYYPDLGFPGAAEEIARFAGCAVDAGVTRFVLLSGRGEPEAARSERALCDVAPHWTVLRSSVFAQNFSEHFLLEPVLDGVIALPAGDVREPFVDLDDLADVAVTALIEDGHDHVIHDLTGPELLSMHDVARELADVTGRPIVYVPVSVDEYVAGAIAAGMPDDEAEGLGELFATIFDGRNAHLTHGVEAILGRPAHRFADYARATAASGVWTVASETEAGVVG